jgi:hypothetical protein
MRRWARLCKNRYYCWMQKFVKFSLFSICSYRMINRLWILSLLPTQEIQLLIGNGTHMSIHQLEKYTANNGIFHKNSLRI